LKLVFKILLLLIITSVLCISVIVFFALQSTPQFKNNKTVDVTAATQSKRAAKRFVAALENTQKPVVLALSQTELNGLSALLNRAFPRVVSDVIIHNKTAKMNMTVELPLPQFIKYLNITGYLYPSNQGIELGDVHIGSLTFSGNYLVSLGRWFADTFVQDELGTKLVNAVQWVTLNHKQLRASLLIPKEMNQLNQGKSGLLALRDKLALFGNVESVKYYYQALVDDIDKSKNIENTKHSLSQYIQFTLSLAKMKTIIHQDSAVQDNIATTEIAITENYSALMALGLYFGADSFEVLVGEVSSLTPAQQKKRNALKNKVTLRNRVDLQKHFMYSVALQLFGNTTASDTIGELKEFLDSNGGSGFSFADLMADRAGTRLAKLATASESSALRIQQLLSDNIKEQDFMPDIDGIPEGISAKVFTTDYRDVESIEYKQMITVLDNRLAELSLYD